MSNKDSGRVGEAVAEWQRKCPDYPNCPNLGCPCAPPAQPAAQPEDSRCPPTYRREEAVKALIGKGWTWDGKAWAEPAERVPEGLKLAKPHFLSAEEATELFREENFITGLNEVLGAIRAACLAQHSCVVNIPTNPLHGDFTSAYWITKKLSKLGYDVVMVHDSENGSSELTVKWG